MSEYGIWFKMQVTPEQSMIVQKKLFDLGYKWYVSRNSKIKKFTASHYLEFSPNATDPEPTLRFTFQKSYYNSNFVQPKATFDEFVLNFEDVFLADKKHPIHQNSANEK